MKASLILLVFGLMILISPSLYSEPGFNGSTPGCGGSGCHTSQTGIVSAIVQNNLEVKITLSSTTSKVGGELVDESGTVVAFINSTSNNPFTLTAPSAGTYKVNAGFKSPNRRWDSTTVSFVLADVGNNIIETTPHAFKLNFNYPNPFNPSTKISYSIPKQSIVTLKVYDQLGNEVSTLVSETKAAGIYEFEFSAKGGSTSGGDVSNLSSGVYFYRLQAGNFVETKKMILLR